MSKKEFDDVTIRKRVERFSQRPYLQQYINNLDKLLEIKTVNTCKSLGGIRFNIECKTFVCENCKQNPHYTKELVLDNKEKKLYINDRDYDWYIIDKERENNRDLFTVIGLGKKKKFSNVKYILGRNEKGKTELRKVIFNLITTTPHDMEDSGVNGLVSGMISTMIGITLMPMVDKITK